MKIQNHVYLPVLKNSRSTLFFIHIIMNVYTGRFTNRAHTAFILSFVRILISGIFFRPYFLKGQTNNFYTVIYRYHSRSGMTWGDTNFFCKWEPILFHCKYLSKFMISLEMLIQLHQNSDQCIYNIYIYI